MTSLSVETLKTYRRIAAAWPEDQRDCDRPWSHYQELKSVEEKALALHDLPRDATARAAREFARREAKVGLSGYQVQRQKPKVGSAVQPSLGDPLAPLAQALYTLDDFKRRWNPRSLSIPEKTRAVELCADLKDCVNQLQDALGALERGGRDE